MAHTGRTPVSADRTPADRPAASGTVVVLHAHPDDEAIFTGVTIHRLARAGVRVVLVTATDGDEGIPRVPLRRGETLASRRLGELEDACAALGVARLELLGHRDSGAHRGPYAPGSLGAVPAEQVARRVAAIAAAEGASAIVHDDRRGIYGHVDHVQVHRAGSLAARMLGITAYETTVDGAALRRGPRHVLHAAAGDRARVGTPSRRISFAVDATPAALAAKREAMAAHRSQIGPEFLAEADFGAAYAREWFVRRGPVGVLDTIAAGSALYRSELDRPEDATPVLA